jgi:hypothetical protein
MTLPPITYMPLAKTKPAERRTNVGRIFKRGLAGALKDINDADETDEADSLRRGINPIAGRAARDDSSEDEDPPKRRPSSTTILLSDGTLRSLLLLQEQENGRAGPDRTEPKSSAGELAVGSTVDSLNTAYPETKTAPEGAASSSIGGVITADRVHSGE